MCVWPGHADFFPSCGEKTSFGFWGERGRRSDPSSERGEGPSGAAGASLSKSCGINGQPRGGTWAGARLLCSSLSPSVARLRLPSHSPRLSAHHSGSFPLPAHEQPEAQRQAGREAPQAQVQPLQQAAEERCPRSEYSQGTCLPANYPSSSREHPLLW